MSYQTANVILHFILMRYPVRLNADRIPGILRRFVPSRRSPASLLCSSPERGGNAVTISRAGSNLRSGDTWRITKAGRHRLTDEAIQRIAFDGSLTILDVGVADGSTSLDLIKRLGSRFDRYYVTDRSIQLRYERRGRVVRFYEDGGLCVCIATPWLVVYPQDAGTTLLHRWARRFLRPTGSNFDGEQGWLSLIQPDLRKLAGADPRIVIREYDVFSSWQGPALALVKVANVLNRCYFPDAQIQSALSRIYTALLEGGRLAIVDNRETDREQASVFVKIGNRFKQEEVIGHGCDISELVRTWRHRGRL